MEISHQSRSTRRRSYRKKKKAKGNPEANGIKINVSKHNSPGGIEDNTCRSIQACDEAKTSLTKGKNQ